MESLEVDLTSDSDIPDLTSDVEEYMEWYHELLDEDNRENPFQAP